MLVATSAAGAEFVVGGGLEADTEDALVLSAFGSVGLAEETWLTATAARSRGDGEVVDPDTAYVDLGLDHWFEPLGVRIGAGYWGDPDLLDSLDARAAVYWKNDRGSVSFDYERRAFDLSIGTRVLPVARTVEFDADGIGASVRVDVNDRVSLRANGMSYDYSRDVEADPDADLLRIFAVSRLNMVNSLIDSRVAGGVDVSFGTRVVDLRVSSWRTAVFGVRVDSLDVGFLTPLGDSSDIEFRLATDDSDAFGRATVFSVFVYFYGL